MLHHRPTDPTFCLRGCSRIPGKPRSPAQSGLRPAAAAQSRESTPTVLSRLRRLAVVFVVGSPFLGSGCNGDDEFVFVSERGVAVADFQSIADYLADPAVQLIFTSMPRNQGSTPPDVAGQYFADGEIVASNIPEVPVGADSDFSICLGTASGSAIHARVLDPSIEEAGAASFIEGSGDDFTVYTGFRSANPDLNGNICEIHEVVVISGRREPDGSLSDLSIGQGVVGVIGECPGVFLDDVTVTLAVGARIADICDGPVGGSPLSRVELVVDNALINPVVVSLDYQDFIGPQPFVVFGGEISQPMLVPPEFELSFESLQPSRFDDLGAENLLGEFISGFFAQDTTPPGQAVTFPITNQVGSDIFFAPAPVNRTGEDIFAIINAGVDFGAAPEPLGSGLGCRCALPPSVQAQNIGYYSYDVPGVIQPSQTSARFFRTADDSEVTPGFFGPFALELDTGVVVLDVLP